MNIKNIKNIYKTLLFNMCTTLFPEYSSMEIGKNNTMVCTYAKSGFLGLFKKKDHYKLIDLLLFHIPRQISINAWHSMDLASYYYNKLTKEFYANSRSLSLQDLEYWISFLHDEASEIKIVNIHQPSKTFTIFRPQKNQFLSNSVLRIENKLKKMQITIKRDAININRAFVCYKGGIIKSIKLVINPAFWLLLFHLAKSPALKHINICSLLDTPMKIISSGHAAFFIT